MRIGMLADTYKPYISGVTNCIALSKRALDSQGHKVYVFTLGNEDYEDDELYIVRSPAIPLSSTGFSFSFRYSRVAQRKLTAMDIVHVHQPFISGQLAFRYCRPGGAPIVFTNHTRYDLYAQAYLPMVPGSLSETFLHAYMPDFCAKCDLVIAPSAGLVQVLRSFGVETPIEVVPNGIDTTPFMAAAPRPRAALGITESDRILIYVGRIGPEKNLTFLLRAFTAAQARVETLHLLVVGDGPELDNLRDHAQRVGLGRRIHFVGAVPYPEVPGWLAMADAFVTASQTEVHPLSAIEAIATGLPLVGIASPGIEDTIGDGRNGFLCPNDLTVFTQRLIQLMSDDTLRQHMAVEARAIANHYDIQRIAAIMQAHYERLIESQARRSADGSRARRQRP